MADAIACVRDEPDSTHPDDYWYSDLVESQSQTLPGQYGRAGLACTVGLKTARFDTFHVFFFHGVCPGLRWTAAGENRMRADGQTGAMRARRP